MAVGKQIGTFSLKSTSLTYGADGTGQVNYEGTVEGEGLTGPVLGTLHITGEPGAKSGTCTWVGTVYPENGEEISSTSEGTWESSGSHQWRVRAVLSLSDGRTQLTDGELVMSTRSYNGTLHEWS